MLKLSWDEYVFLQWIRGLSNKDQESLDLALENQSLEVPPSVFSSYPHELLEITPVIGSQETSFTAR